MARINPAGLISESDTNNNTLFSISTFSLLGDLQPDANNFEFGGIVPPPSYNRGDEIEITKIRVRNIGLFDIVEVSSVQVILTRDLTLGNLDDIILIPEAALGQGLGGGDPAGEFVDLVPSSPLLPAFVPNDTPEGEYRLAVRADSTGVIPESNEANNTIFSGPASIIINGPKLGLALEDDLAGPSIPTQFGEQQGLDPLLGGVSSWFGQGTMVHLGTNAGQAGAIGDGQESFFEVNVFFAEVFQISFNWAVSSEAGFDFLIFSINGEEIDAISGDVAAFAGVTRTLDPGSYTFRFTYRKDGSVSAFQDTAWVDSIVFTASVPPPLSDPDFVVSTADFTPDTYIVQRDNFEFNALGLNIGGNLIPIPSLPLFVEAVLTIDTDIGNGDDIVLGLLQIIEPLDESNQYVLHAEIEIPSTNRSGNVIPASANYRLGLRIDPVNGGPPTGNFVELDEDNNAFLSSDPDIIVETRPDLKVENFIHEDGRYAFGEEIPLSFELVNGGLRGIPSVAEGGDPIRIRLFMNQGVFTEFDYSEGLDIGERRFFQMSVTVTEDHPISIDCGHPNALADVTDVVEESNEENNVSPNFILDTFVTGVDLGEALDSPQLLWEREGSFCRPWIGQTDDSLDEIDAVSAPQNLGEGEFSTVSTSVFIDQPTFVSFWFKGEVFFQVRKSGEIVHQANRESPQGEDIWSLHTFSLEAFDFYTFTFFAGDVLLEADLVQISGETLEAGEVFMASAAITVDLFNLFFPEIEVSNLEFSGALPQILIRGDTIDLSDAVLEIVNTGQLDVPANSPIIFQFVLSTDQNFNDVNDILIRSDALGVLRDTHRIQLDDALVASEDPLIPRDLSEFFNLKIPEYTPPGIYFVGVLVNATGEIFEVDGSNNVFFTTQSIVQVDPGANALSLDVALDLDVVAPPIGPLASTRVEQVPWFGQTVVTNDGTDAAQTPFLEEGLETSFEVAIEGPAEVTFNWKTDTLENLNSIGLFIDGTIDRRVSGLVDWTPESVVLGPGDHTLRWAYQKGKNTESQDVGYVDQIAVNIFDVAVTNITGANETLDRGDTVGAINISIFNDGNSDVVPDAGLEGQVFLTLDGTIGNADDLFLQSFPLSGTINPGNTNVEVFNTGVIPPTANPGVYNVVVIFDTLGFFNEVNEDNNTLVATGFTITVDPALVPSIAEAVDHTPPPDFIFGGDGAWFGQTAESEPITDDGDAVQSPALLVAGQQAFFEITVPGPFNLQLDWRIKSASDSLTLTVDGQVIDSIVGDTGAVWESVDINVQSSATDRVVRITYQRNNNEADDPGAMAFVDNVAITALTLPDLIITELQFTEGTFVIQRDTPLIITVTGVNAGVTMGDPPVSDLFSVEVRLSIDKIWGNSDDIVLGKLNEIEEIGTDGRFVFNQKFFLNICLPEGDYHVAVFVDSTEIFLEFDEGNNFSFSDQPDVTIDAQPNLFVRSRVFRNGSYFREGELQFQFDVDNIGCEEFPIGENYDIQVDFIGEFTNIFDDQGADRTEQIRVELLDRTLATFGDNRGIGFDPTLLNPPGVTFKTSLQMPRYNEDEVTDVYGFGDLAEQDPVPTGTPADEGFIPIDFALDVVLSSETVSMVNVDAGGTTTFLGTHNINILATPINQSFADFQGFWDAEPSVPGDVGGSVGALGADDDGDGLTNLQEMAFGTDPRVANPMHAFDTDAAGTEPGPAFGFIQLNGDQFLSVTFNRLAPSANGELIDYVVEVSENGMFNDTVVLITMDSFDSINTLLLDPAVVSVIDNFYLQRVTVKDVGPVSGFTSRFIRVRIVDN